MSACEGGSHLPLIARWPGRIPAGSISDEILATVGAGARNFDRKLRTLQNPIKRK